MEDVSKANMEMIEWNKTRMEELKVENNQLKKSNNLVYQSRMQVRGILKTLRNLNKIRKITKVMGQQKKIKEFNRIEDN